MATLGKALSDHHITQEFWSCLQWDCAVTTKGCSDASHETPSLLNGEGQKLPEGDPQPMVGGLELDFLSCPPNPAHFIILNF